MKLNQQTSSVSDVAAATIEQPKSDLELMNDEEYRKIVLQKRRRNKIVKTIKGDILGWLMGGWPFIGAMLFGLFPTILGYMLPFMDMEGFDYATMKPVGFDNFVWLLTSPKSNFFLAIKNSLYYSISVPIYMGMALFIAVQLDKNIKGTKAFRIIMFLPNFVSAVAMSIFWQFMFDKNGGINSLIGLFGIKPIDFLGVSNVAQGKIWFMPATIFTGTWGVSANSILFQAALANVNVSIKEAAWLDGASERQTFWKITFPSISPTTFYQLIMSMVGALQVFTSLQLLSTTDNGPGGAALSVVLYMYNMAFVYTGPDYGLGMAGACGLMYQILLTIITIIVFKTKDKWVHDNG